MTWLSPDEGPRHADDHPGLDGGRWVSWYLAGDFENIAIHRSSGVKSRPSGTNVSTAAAHASHVPRHRRPSGTPPGRARRAGVPGLGRRAGGTCLASNPLRPVGQAHEGPQLDELRDAVVTSLELGLGAGGATIDDFRHADGVRGRVPGRVPRPPPPRRAVPGVRARDREVRRRRARDVRVRGLPDAAARAGGAREARGRAVRGRARRRGVAAPAASGAERRPQRRPAPRRPAPAPDRRGRHPRAPRRAAARSPTATAATARRARRGDRATVDYIAAHAARGRAGRVRSQDVSFPFFELRGAAAARRPARAAATSTCCEYSGSGTVTGRVAAARRPRPATPPRSRRCGAATSPSSRAARARSASRRATPQRAGAAALVVVDREAEPRRSQRHARRPGPSTSRSSPPRRGGGAALARAERPRHARASTTTSERRTTRNVIAELPGRRRRPRRHGRRPPRLGRREGPGINDNGSGVAALLEIAERLRRAAPRPAARVLDRRGARPATARAATSAALAARRAPAHRAPTSTSTWSARRTGAPEVYDTDDALERAAARARSPGASGRPTSAAHSDHAPFQRAGIPVGGLFTGAERARLRDRCYHRALRHGRATSTRRWPRAMATRRAERSRAARSQSGARRRAARAAAALVGGQRLLEAADELAADDDLREAHHAGPLDELGPSGRVACQIDLRVLDAARIEQLLDPACRTSTGRSCTRRRRSITQSRVAWPDR